MAGRRRVRGAAPIDACGDCPIVLHTNDREYQYVGRINWQRSTKDSLFFRYFITDYSQPDYFVPGNLALNNGPGLAGRAHCLLETRTPSAPL